MIVCVSDKGKDKGHLFPLPRTPEGIRIITGTGEENANYCCSSSSKPYIPVHFLEHMEVFRPSLLERSTEGHFESSGVSESIINL